MVSMKVVKGFFLAIVFITIYQTDAQTLEFNQAIINNDVDALELLFNSNPSIFDSVVYEDVSRFSSVIKHPFHTALEKASLPTITYLLNIGADPTKPMILKGFMTSRRIYALQILVERGDSELISHLMDDLNVTPRAFGDAITFAAETKAIDIYNILVEKGEVIFFN